MFDSIFKAEFWQYEYFGNSLKEYVIAVAAFSVFILLFKIFQSFVLSRLKSVAERTKSDIDDEFIEIFKSIRPPFYTFLAFYLALRFLALNAFLAKAVNIVLVIWVVYQAITVVQVFINYLVRKKFSQDDKQSRAAAGTVGILVKVVLWMVALLLVLSNLGFNVNSLIAGLGIGGIAVAMALQSVLGDLFGSFAIYFDKPFRVGDFIVVGDTMGVVEKIGIKTTRLRALQGEEIVMSNSDLTSSKIQNFKKMRERRVVFGFGVTYETSSEKLKSIPSAVRGIVESTEAVRFDRAHFVKFADFSLNFEVVYYVLSGEYNRYMDINQEIHLKIKEVFEKEGIAMAYPTQTVYLTKS